MKPCESVLEYMRLGHEQAAIKMYRVQTGVQYSDEDALEVLRAYAKPIQSIKEVDVVVNEFLTFDCNYSRLRDVMQEYGVEYKVLKVDKGIRVVYTVNGMKFVQERCDV